jgi:hypothetical protein
VPWQPPISSPACRPDFAGRAVAVLGEMSARSGFSVFIDDAKRRNHRTTRFDTNRF